MKNRISKWLNTKSEFYSKICEFNVTRGTIIKTNVIVLLFFCYLACVESYPAICLGIILAVVIVAFCISDEKIEAKQKDK